MYRAELVAREGELATFDIECSSGTYVRQLVAALGDAYCAELRRTTIGDFAVADADPATLVPPARALAFMPERELDGEQARLISHGVKLALEEGEDVPGPVRLMHEDRLVAVAERRDRQLAPVVVFSP